ncbi:MAG: creatininase family protein [Parvibaculaceae bacterium]
MKGEWLEDLTWPEAGRRLEEGRHVVVPIGARAKEHGHHLPLKTDFMLARALCDGIAAELPVLVAPVVDFGYYPAFTAYPGSQHLKAETFMALLTEVIEPFILHGARAISIVNTGVSTEGPVEIVVRELQARHGMRIAVAHIRRLGAAGESLLGQKFGGHADEHETSLILAIDAAAVRMDRARQDYGHAAEEPDTVFYRPTRFSGDQQSPGYSETGARGDPTLATAEKGRAILAAQVSDLVSGLRKLDPVLA